MLCVCRRPAPWHSSDTALALALAAAAQVLIVLLACGSIAMCIAGMVLLVPPKTITLTLQFWRAVNKWVTGRAV